MTRGLLCRRFYGALVAVFFVQLSSCQDNKDFSQPSCEIGVFYGGQIQQKKEVELSVTTPPNLGFRVVLPLSEKAEEAAAFADPIFYQVIRPGPLGRRVKESGTLTPREDQREISQVIDVPPDAEGLWNIRVIFRERILADRALYLRRPRN